VSLDRAPVPIDPNPDFNAVRFAAALRGALGGERDFRVQAIEWPQEPPAGPGAPRGWPRRFDAPARGAAPGGGPGMMMGPGMGMGMGMGAGMHGGMLFMTQVLLGDGTWVTFDTLVPRPSADLPLRLVATLVISLAAVLLLSLFAVRWVVRPLGVLAKAADALGRDIDRAPLPETGPLEVRHAASAFNAMQGRLQRFIRERTSILAAMSHDIKTPLTRMRLRAELLDDEMRERFGKDLGEIEAMVSQTLEFVRGVGTAAQRQPVNVDALLESLQADYVETGRNVRVEGEAAGQVIANAPLLRRCLGNLLDNAIAYAGSAVIAVSSEGAELVLRVLDEGPGIPEADLEKVFEPFHRLEGSRSRATGGTGLGLTIARNIAQGNGGDLVLRNRPQGGLEAVLTLPRGTTP
jgi:signal transduction histidine kinase